MREDIEICNFTAGQLSRKLKGRTDYERYYNGAETQLNMVSLPQGGATRRPGFLAAALSADQTNGSFRARMIPFVFSTVQSYMLEFTSGNIRVYANDAVVVSGGSPVDISVPYQAADIAALAFTQSADTLFICHPNYPLATLTRSSNTEWTYSAAALRDGPYLPINTTTTTLTPSGTSGSITITASSVVGINVTPTSTGLGFQSTDVGRMIRIQLFSLWAWCLITAVDSTTEVTATVQPRVLNAGAYGAIDGAPWAANTQYPAGAVVENNSSYYIVTSAGVSGDGYGPCGTGDNIIDGSVVWSLAGPFNATGYTANTVYACGDIIQNPATDGTYYECIQGGNIGDHGGPSGTGNDIAVAATIWMSIAPFSFPTSTIYWQLGQYSGTTGYPQLPTFWQGRLALLGTSNQPNAVNASVSNDFTNFAPTQADGTVVASNALSWLINDNQVNAMRWVTPAGSSVAMQLGIGTAGGETVMQPATNSEALSPSNVQVYRETAEGSAPNVPAVRVAKSVLFANRPGRKLFDWIWQWALNGYLPIDRTADADDITLCTPPNLQGIVMMAWQAQPYRVLWCVRGDGVLIGLTYMPDQKVVAWHMHQLGGKYYGGPPIVESAACIPSPDGTYDELWVSVLRSSVSADGAAGPAFRTTEVMTRYFDGMNQEDSFFVDCGATSDLVYPAATLFIGGSVPAGPCTAPANGNVVASPGVFSSGSVGSYIRANNGVMVITSVANSENANVTLLSPIVNQAPAASGSWSMTPQYPGFSGFLSQLDNQTVQMLGDGADMGTTTVAGGAVSLPAGQTASYLIAGLAYTYDLITMPWAPQRAVPVPAVGKTKMLNTLYLRLYEALGVSFGRHKTDPLTGAVTSILEPLKARRSSTPYGMPPPLATGLQRVPMRGGFDEEGQVEITGSGPYPCTVLAISASGDVGTS